MNVSALLMGWEKMIQYSVYTYSLNITSVLWGVRRTFALKTWWGLIVIGVNISWIGKMQEKQELTARKEATCFLLREAHTCRQDVHACTYSDAHMLVTLRRCSKCGRIKVVQGAALCPALSQRLVMIQSIIKSELDPLQMKLWHKGLDSKYVKK